jgi:hypothetical protein
MSIELITRARTKRLQEAINGLVKEFIWGNPLKKEAPSIYPN